MNGNIFNTTISLHIMVIHLRTKIKKILCANVYEIYLPLNHSMNNLNLQLFCIVNLSVF